MKKINVTDITLKTLAQDRAVSLLFREKTAIAFCAASLGANAVELAPIASLREDTIIYKTIAQNVKNTTVAIPVGMTAESIEQAWECVKDAAKPRLQVEVPTSTVQMEYLYHVKADKMLTKISELTEKAKSLCADVEFVALDATRADADFLIAAAKTAVEKGAGIVTICDTAGIALPEETAQLVASIAKEVSVPVYVQVSDQINLAVASAVSAVRAGASGLKCAMAGNDSLSMGEFADLVRARGEALDIETDLNNTKIHTDIDEMLSHINREALENDIAVSEKKQILLDAESDLTQVAQAAQVLGYDLSTEDLGLVYKAVIQICENRGAVGAKEFEAVIASTAMQAPSTYHLESYTTTSSSNDKAMSQITLSSDGEFLSGVSIGNGPIDSMFRAIEQCIGHHYELDDFQIQAVTEGKGALGSALVRLRNNGKLYSGNGISGNIVVASIRAYINALNKIVSEED